MREYETVIVLEASLDDSRVDQEVEAVEKIIADGGGEVLDVQRWGKRRLAYEVDKKREGIYSLVRFRSEPDVLDQLGRRYRLNEVLLRHITVLSRGAAPVPTQDRSFEEGRRSGRSWDRDRGGRGDRGDRGDRGAGGRGDAGDRRVSEERPKKVEGAGSSEQSAAAGEGEKGETNPAGTVATAAEEKPKSPEKTPDKTSETSET